MKHYRMQCCLAGLAMAVSILPARAGETLVMNGKTASSDVRKIGGALYVKVADVARALGMMVVKRPDGRYEITKTGGANQVQGITQGKVGDVLFDGFWRFQVLSVSTPQSYTMKYSEDANNLHYDRDAHAVSSNNAQYEMVVVQCRMINAQKTAQTFWIAPLPGERSINNALTDTDGGSYPPDAFDLEGTTSQSKRLLPGAGTNFAMLFRVPAGAHVKDLIFTLQNNDSSAGHDVRVSLTSGANE